MQLSFVTKLSNPGKGVLIAISLFWAAAVCSQTPQPEPISITAGPMVGHVWDTGVHVWVQLSRAGSISLDVRKAGTAEWQKARWKDGGERYKRVWPDSGFAGIATFEGLEPGTKYEYRLRSRNVELPVLGEQSFRTPPSPGQAEDFRLCYGSCASNWGPDPNQPIWASVDALRPDVFLFLGDNVYYDREGQEWAHPEMMWARYRQGRSLPAIQPLLRRTACYAIWDDHDYGPDDSDKLYLYKDLSLHIFRNYWPNSAYGSDGMPGIWHRFTRGKVEFFMLDGRFYRDPEDAPNDEHKSMLGPTQKAWLEATLKKSTATFKVVVAGSQILARYHEYESFDQYRTERAWLLDIIRKNGIPGVVFLTGDRHVGEMLRWQQPEMPYPLHEFTSSPLAAGLATQPPPDAEVPDRVPGSIVMAENFGEVVFSGMDTADPRMTVQFHGIDGAPVGARVELRASDLQPSP